MVLTPQQRSEIAARAGAGNKGKPKTQEHRDKIRDAHLGHTVSKETREKISKSLRARSPSEKTCKYCKDVFLGGGNSSICVNCWPIHYEARTARYRWKKYGIDEDDYKVMLARQGGVCAVCERVSIGRWLCVDHDHVTGDVRGLLCESCNLVLGKMNDDPSLLRRAATYLEMKGN